MAGASSCFSLATAHVHLKAIPASLEPIGPWAKAVFSRVYMPNSACSMEVCYSPCSWNPVLSPALSRKGMFRLSSSSVTQEGMQSVSEEEKSGEEEDAPEISEPLHDIPAGTKVYLGNLPFSCDSAELAGFIQEHGSVEMVEVIYDQNTGRSRGFAFATMSSVEDANALVQNLDGSQYGGRTLRVNLREEASRSLRVNLRDKPRSEQRNPNNNDGQHRVYIGNLSWDVNEEILNEVFSEHGNLLDAKIVFDRETGRSRGFGFITFSTLSEAEAAVASLNGKELEGRAMRVDLALSSRNTE